MGRAKKDSQGEPDVNSAFSPAKDKGDSSSESYEEVSNAIVKIIQTLHCCVSVQSMCQCLTN